MAAMRASPPRIQLASVLLAIHTGPRYYIVRSPLLAGGPMGDTATRIAGTLADRYFIEAEIGRGGMATVYRAHDLRHDRAVAVKIIRPELASVLSSKRFAREVLVTGRLQHPNILGLLDSGESDDLPYYVMPLVDGENLHARLRRERQLPIDEAIELASQIADALSYAHAEGIIHRDIKPSNILLSHGHAIVADFGIARALDSAAGDSLTDSGVAVGTMHYMSPEQAAGEPVDARTDIYSLGCLLYEMLAGSPPFTGANSQSVRARHAVDPVPSLRTVRTTAPVALQEVIEKALAKSPADRYASALDFKTALRAASKNARTLTRRQFATRGGIAVAAIVVAGVIWRVAAATSQPLDPNRVMVFPVATPSGPQFSSSLAEDAATIVGSAIDGAGPLRWIDAWPLLSANAREAPRNVAERLATRLAAAQRCGRYLTGRIVAASDSTILLLDLWSTDSGVVIAHGRASAGRNADVWRLALRAVNDLLPHLVAGASPNMLAGWTDRAPAAIANFLLGEAAFRRAHFEEALSRYSDAVRADSTFALAAIRGAQAAVWNDHTDRAAALVAVATRQTLQPRYAHLARGYTAYLTGDAELAVTELRAALSADPQLAVAWASLGEVYSHLLTRIGEPDAIADDAFQRALQLDSAAANVLYHPIQLALRQKDLARARPLIARFLAARPETTSARTIEIMAQCVERGAARVSWEEIARVRPRPLIDAAFQLAAGAANLPCAASGFKAILAVDTANDRSVADGRRWVSLIGVTGVLLAQGRSREAAATVDSFNRRWGYGASLYLIAGPYDSLMANGARELARSDAEKHGATYAKVTSNYRLWALGQWALHEGNRHLVDTILADLRLRADKTKLPLDLLLVHSLDARATLARGDTSKAIALLRAIVPVPFPRATIQWNEIAPVPGERLLLSQLLLATGDASAAIATADVFDSPAASIYPLFLRSSLTLRADAAASLGDNRLSTHLRNRLRRSVEQ